MFIKFHDSLNLRLFFSKITTFNNLLYSIVVRYLLYDYYSCGTVYFMKYIEMQNSMRKGVNNKKIFDLGNIFVCI